VAIEGCRSPKGERTGPWRFELGHGHKGRKTLETAQTQQELSETIVVSCPGEMTRKIRGRWKRFSTRGVKGRQIQHRASQALYRNQSHQCKNNHAKSRTKKRKKPSRGAFSDMAKVNESMGIDLKENTEAQRTSVRSRGNWGVCDNFGGLKKRNSSSGLGSRNDPKGTSNLNISGLKGTQGTL